MILCLTFSSNIYVCPLSKDDRNQQREFIHFFSSKHLFTSHNLLFSVSLNQSSKIRSFTKRFVRQYNVLRLYQHDFYTLTNRFRKLKHTTIPQFGHSVGHITTHLAFTTFYFHPIFIQTRNAFAHKFQHTIILLFPLRIVSHTGPDLCPHWYCPVDWLHLRKCWLKCYYSPCKLCLLVRNNFVNCLYWKNVGRTFM